MARRVRSKADYRNNGKQPEVRADMGVAADEMGRRRRRVAELQKLIKPLTEIKKEKINDRDQPDGA